MANDISLTGRVLRVNVPERYRHDGHYSPVLIVQFGEQCARKRGKNVRYQNAVPVRVPASTWQAVQSRVGEGTWVRLDGHIQGISRESDDYPWPHVEIVVDCLEVWPRNPPEGAVGWRLSA